MNEDHNFGSSVRIVIAVLPDFILSEGVLTGIPGMVILLVSRTPSVDYIIQIKNCHIDKLIIQRIQQNIKMNKMKKDHSVYQYIFMFINRTIKKIKLKRLYQQQQEITFQQYFLKKYNLMDSFGQLVSLFPYVDLWRIRGKPNLTSKLSIFVSVLLIVVIGSIAISKLIQVYKMTTVFASQQSQMNMLAPMTNITTSHTNQEMKQFMFALYVEEKASKQPKLKRQDYKMYGSHVQQNFNQTSGIYDTQSTYFQLQKCTHFHFLNVPDIQKNYYSWNIDNWMCLPMNKNFEIGGIAISNSKFLQVGISCHSSNCKNSTINGLLVRGYILNTFINPTNYTQPFRSFIYKYQSTLQPLSESNKYFYINKNTLATDNSLLPFESLKIENSMDTYPDVITNEMKTLQGCGVPFFISHSGTIMKYKRKYLKILDALSYLGGIFNALLGAFFFMNAFGKLFFEIEFARLVFNKQQLKKNNIWTALKHGCYKILLLLGRQPDWEFQKTIQKYKRTVNTLLDIVYLQRRLQFLQRAVEIMFEKHHLKGLYLSYYRTREETDRKFKDHSMKKTLYEYFKRKEEARKTQSQTQLHNNPKCLEINLFSSDKSKKSQTCTNTDILCTDLRLNRQKSLEIDLKVDKKMQTQKEMKSQKDFKNAEDGIEVKSIVLEQRQKSEDQLINQENIRCILKLYRETKMNNEDERSRQIFQRLDTGIKQKIEELFQNNSSYF